jgi:predicted tellurium resistance membrane protein TerC
MPSEKSLTARLVGFAAAVLLVAVLLTLAVWLIQQIWVWLLAGTLIVVLIWIGILVVRWRRDRWLR